ncbi:DUF6438 domain-containing protein [Chryseobacterium potabilaquae]|uniref:DUF6438 domain-containing protein n=1 Tax=Chryseobacterium potabilaquae TaxID=2675057 RepID=A0A6N4X3W5_9FLAO|nr:DUF6438 domain-containing protein [Chryseobacterium potabilaquae]CAA7194682.1 hypothetical protein CHRY9293_00970 [Chryseobacterium potabilaquae]
MKYLLSFLAFALMLSCNSQTPVSSYSKIEYEAGGCFGSCPIFTIAINPDRTAILEAEHFNFNKNQTFSKSDFSKPREGTFTTTIKEKDYQKLLSLLDGLNIKSLNENYGKRNITDMPSAYLRIQFKDGTSKNIEDYGKHGTEKLAEMYTFFENLRHNQQWTKVK